MGAGRRRGPDGYRLPFLVILMTLTDSGAADGLRIPDDSSLGFTSGFLVASILSESRESTSESRREAANFCRWMISSTVTTWSPPEMWTGSLALTDARFTGVLISLGRVSFRGETGRRLGDGGGSWYPIWWAMTRGSVTSLQTVWYPDGWNSLTGWDRYACVTLTSAF